MLTLACDEATGFTLVNSTEVPVVVTYSVLSDPTDTSPLGENSYRLDPGEDVNTSTEVGLSGDKGGEIFNERHVLRISAESDGSSVFDRVYTYEEAKSLEFRFVIE
jgi:hypothetical protein